MARADHAVWLSFCAVLIACGSLPRPPVRPPPRPETTVPAGLAHDPPLPLVLLPGDKFDVRTVSNEESAITGLVVDDAGRTYLPLAGLVEIGGLSVEEAADRIQERLRRFDRFVRVSIVVTDAAGHFATVLGAVERPGRVQLAPGFRLADVIAQAGGPRYAVPGFNGVGNLEALADVSLARLYRNGRVIPVSIELALQGNPRHNIRAHAGDSIIIPVATSNKIAVQGQVHQAREISYRDDLRLSDAIAQAGGLTNEADDGDVRIMRSSPGGGTRTFQVDLDEIVSGEAPDVYLDRGDVIYVEQSGSSSFGTSLQRLGPIIGPIFGAILTVAVTYVVIDLNN